MSSKILINLHEKTLVDQVEVDPKMTSTSHQTKPAGATLVKEHSLADFAHLDEKAILRKMDLRLIPMLAILYLLAFLGQY